MRAGVLLTTAAAAVLLLIAVAKIALSPRAISSCQHVIVPAYFYPGPGWARADGSTPVPAAMILDVSTFGAGSSPDRAYQAAVRRAQAAGIRILGYSATDYARRPATAVESDVKNYRAWYHVTDIFLDQVSSAGSQVPYYRRLAGYIHAMNPGSMVMLNPGTYPDERYMSVGDVVVVFENTYASYVNLHIPSWVGKYPAAKFADIIYATPGSRLASAIGMSRRRHDGYVYVTGGGGPNPYSSLPGYWPRENGIIAAQCGLPQNGYRPG